MYLGCLFSVKYNKNFAIHASVAEVGNSSYTNKYVTTKIVTTINLARQCTETCQ